MPWPPQIQRYYSVATTTSRRFLLVSLVSSKSKAERNWYHTLFCPKDAKLVKPEGWKLPSQIERYHIVTSTIIRNDVAIACEDRLAQRIKLKEFGAMAPPKSERES